LDVRSDQTYEGIHEVSSSHVLADFLDRIHKADDPSVELDLIRAHWGLVIYLVVWYRRSGETL